ncbi:MAG: IctB family putative bicarbonate transporter [Geitlerinemataceae cyanobacterium]
MNALLQSLTLSGWSPDRWQRSSLLLRLTFGSLSNWRRGSVLMSASEPVGMAIVAIVLAVAPFVPTALVGVLLMCCIAFFGLLTLSDTTRFFLTPIHCLVLLYWAVSSVAMGFSPVREAAFSGWVKLTLYLGLFFLAARALRKSRLRAWAIGVALLVALVTSVYGIQQSIVGVEQLATWTDPNSSSADATRIYSYLGNPNLFGGYLIAATFFSASACLAWRRIMPKLLAIVMLLVNTAALAMTYSRGAWLGLVAGGFVFTLLLVWWWSDRLPPKLRPWAVPGMLAVSAAAVLFAAVAVPPIRNRIGSIFVGRGDSSNNFRINVWAAVLDMIRDRPILGIGPGNDAFNKVYPLYMRPKYSALSAYSVLLEVTVEAGVLGLFSFLWLLGVVAYQGDAQLRRLRSLATSDGYWLIAALASVAGIMAHGTFDTVFYRPPIQTLWWFVLAVVASFYVPVQVREANS